MPDLPRRSQHRISDAAEDIQSVFAKRHLTDSEVVTALMLLLAPMLGSMNRDLRRSALKYQSQMVRDFTRQPKRHGGGDGQSQT
ncbi:putative cation efflux system protein CusC [Roseibium sp. TrichSKD4]|uniref:hypothetical protein n=1 Tax=Roseibium sp. TrichSKD4 TaxID=744980 RepID=UPI0001E57618|nr:hypothetical protein [Roseibium sp. TrichSKD4]EFO30959.1 putative cation efflux system protein CusC [Roseibium sp. TrichSKD4]